jgi:uncharacterized protein (TIGR00730 family)
LRLIKASFLMFGERGRMHDRTMTPSPRRALLAVEDTDFLLRPEMRAMRFALEYAKADLSLRDHGIRSTIIVFGSARCLSPEQAKSRAPEMDEAHVKRQLAWYEAARTFGRIASERGGALASHFEWRDNVIATGGGPGLMEAANRGATEAGAPSIGFNITLPHEQDTNAFVTPTLSFRFHYFAMRKMHLAMRANALVVFPGGFGTLDELFELLNLQQTEKAPRAPIVLFDRSYWSRLINFDALADEGMISSSDLELFDFAETPDQAWDSLTRRGLYAHSPGKDAPASAPAEKAPGA